MKFFHRVLPFLAIIGMLAFYFFSSSDETQGQNDFSYIYADDNYVEGEIIVMLNPGENINDLLGNFSDINLRVKEELVDHMNIWLLEYDVARSSAPDALISVMRRSEVAVAQFNHNNVVERQAQTFPNDTRFNEQWDYHNTGQTGGTPDADVDGPEAWSIATGGNTSLGDSIVVAVIDGGFDLAHPDLNFWRNRAEIPANGIDDDGNGYIDDVNGWNAYNNNGSITSSQHGTHVSGTVGARGNNNLGVAGTNWNVKVMAVMGSSGTESVVVTAYGYVLKQRKIYNQTNGSQGAFVVSTNSSFGVDFGNPANFPLWCAFYDSLGNAGVLSAAATMNNNSNVDVTGDVPTACPSNFLISVTNTTNTDAKNSGAAYGLTTIDLGAPGTSILSTNPSAAYGTSTGTSMASPHVAGAVGLMMSGASPYYVQLGRTRPDSLAKLVKQFMLASVDTLPSLTGITVSNGRLNLYKALQKVRISSIPVLNPFTLQNPANGVTITTYPNATATHTFTWDTSATGAQYNWFFGSPTAGTRKFQFTSGTNSVTLTSGQLDAILAGLGVTTGGSMAGQWNVWAIRYLPSHDSISASNGPRNITFTRGVPPLTAFNLNSPPNNTTIVTSVFNSSAITINWTRSGPGSTYKWKFGSPTISTPVITRTSANGGYDSVLTMTNSDLDLILNSAGLQPGDSLIGQYAVWAYNGLDSLKSTQTYNLTLKRQAKGNVIILYDSSSAAGITSKDSVVGVLNQVSETYDLFNRGTQTSTNAISLRGYKKVILLGQATNVMNTRLKDSVIAYLNSGGTTNQTKSKLLIYSEDIGYQFGRAASTYYDANFVSRLGWFWVSDRPSSGANQGLVGDYLNTGLRDSTIGSWPDVLRRDNTHGTSRVLYRFRIQISNPDSANAIGLVGSTYNVATFGDDIRSLRNAVNGATGSPVYRFVMGGLTFVDSPTGIEPLSNTSIPDKYELSQNYPNPFNPVTNIKFALPKNGQTTLKVYDLLGRQIAVLVNENLNAGYYNIQFDASRFASGAYFYRIEASGFIETKRMMLIK